MRNAKHASSFMLNVSIKAKHCSKLMEVGYVHVGAIWRIKRFQDGMRETKLKIKITILDSDLEQQNNTNWYI